MDTIIAQATSMGKAGVAVIRISGEKALDVAKAFAPHIVPTPRYAHYTRFLSPADNSLIDSGLLLYFPAPYSFTGEDVIEIHCHGSRPVISRFISEAIALPHIRYAEAGEFTRRALHNQKMDLLQVEALADLIDAETPRQHQLANRQLSGFISHHYQSLEKQLLEARAFCEVFIDFPDEDLPDTLDEQIAGKINNCIHQLQQILSQAAIGKQIRDGVQVAIIGIPNAGKSTLINAIAGRKVAITSDIAGTTRDAIELYKDINGVPFRFFDTAGIRQTQDEIENQGVTIATEIASQADILLFLIDATRSIEEQWSIILPIIESENVSRETILVVNKMDAANFVDEILLESIKNVSRETFLISALQQSGVQHVLDYLSSKFQSIIIEDIYITRDRHIYHLQQALCECQSALQQSDLVLVSQHMIYACKELEMILGKIEIERILDVLFSSFCIGK